MHSPGSIPPIPGSWERNSLQHCSSKDPEAPVCPPSKRRPNKPGHLDIRVKKGVDLLSFVSSVCRFPHSYSKLFFFFVYSNKQRLSRPVAVRPGAERCQETHHGDADGVLILLGEDTHQGRAQQQQDQGVLKLKRK